MSKELLAALLPLIIQFSITGVKDGIALFEGNPQQQGEIDADYIARMGALIDANTAAIDKEDDAIQE